MSNNITGVTTSSGLSGSSLTYNGAGNLVWAPSYTDNHNVTFSKQNLEQLFREFQSGKYTRRYMEVYLEFMVLNAMLDNLTYLEYKQLMSKE
jgi:hypothetical protein